MATEAVMMPSQEIADLTAQPEAAQGKTPNRLQKRIDRFSRTIHELQETIQKLEAGEFQAVLSDRRQQIEQLSRSQENQNKNVQRMQSRYGKAIAHGNKLAAENTGLKLKVAELEKSLSRALDLRDAYAQQLRQCSQKLKPLTPNFHERESK